ncbi:vanadium-dependent haloperoxidase [Modestobacter sp. I12A-02662]|uniref:vanadium-dependent haloperoxidase n=1 Tax=Modestobacter sp. I12A-02662 TaxID=1730496 RepID=UPI0034DE5CE8
MSTTPTAHRQGICIAAALLVLGVTPTAAAGEAEQARGDPGVALSWNAIAWRTIGVEGQKPPPVAQLYLGLVSTAVYDAVRTAEAADGPAASDVAAATAAHDALAHFFPASQTALDADYDAWLAGVPDDEARQNGRQAGADAAAALIADRADDGREAPITLPRPADPPPGMWVPTGTGEMTAPWLGFTEPLLIDSPEQFATDGPDPLDSEEYAADVAEVAAMGSATSTARTAEQTDLALFWSDNPIRQYQDAMRERAVRHGMDIVGTVRMLAAANTAGADALITCWRGKYDVPLWRPITAIQQADRDGNPATTPDPAWSSLRPAPPYPEWPSGHACVSSAVAETLEELFGAGQVDMEIRSSVTGTTRIYDDEQAWLDDVVNARVWLGIHFRDAVDDARETGRAVADAVACEFGSSDS